MRSTETVDSLTQAFDLLTAVFKTNQYKFKPDYADWLKQESEISSSGRVRFDKLLARTYEGIFRSIRSSQALEPTDLWYRAGDRLAAEAARGRTGAESESPRLYHRRLVRLYWMFRLGLEDLIAEYPGTRLVRLLVEIEKELREAFVETGEEVRLPPEIMRKRQWRLLQDYGMGLRVEELYDLGPKRESIRSEMWKNVAIAFVLGFVLGMFVYKWLVQSPTP